MSANVNPAEVSAHQAPRILVVDDSLTVRRASQRLLERHGYAVTLARDGLDALEQLRLNTPAAVLLDIEMPRMDGLDFLEKLMRLRPMPVVMVSTLTERGAETTLRALELGAVDFVAKPRLGVAQGLQEMAIEITDKVRVAAKARIVAFDMVEFMPERDIDGQGALVAAQLLAGTIGILARQEAAE
jgi:two-component system chemotaxis response regulator CheB